MTPQRAVDLPGFFGGLTRLARLARHRAGCAPAARGSLRGTRWSCMSDPTRARNQRLEVCRRRNGERSVLVRGNYYGSLAGRRTVAARGNTVAFAEVSRDDGADGDAPFTFVTVWRRRSRLTASSRFAPTATRTASMGTP